MLNDVQRDREMEREGANDIEKEKERNTKTMKSKKV
jgi:hypothetical protein